MALCSRPDLLLSPAQVLKFSSLRKVHSQKLCIYCSFFFWAPIPLPIHQNWHSWWYLLPSGCHLVVDEQVQRTLHLGGSLSIWKVPRVSITSFSSYSDFSFVFKNIRGTCLYACVFENLIPYLGDSQVNSEVRGGCLSYQITTGTNLFLLIWAFPIFTLVLICALCVNACITD